MRHAASGMIKARLMRSVLKSSFLWQFAGGFVLGTLGLVALQPADARQSFIHHLDPVAHFQR
jgi:hypothetical protein